MHDLVEVIAVPLLVSPAIATLVHEQRGPALLMLTDPEIEVVVASHRMQLPRFEDAARVVEQRSRTALERWAVPALTSSRAKSSRSLRDRLRRHRDDPEFELANLQTRLDHFGRPPAGAARKRRGA